jgi:hypothetical protein
MKPKRLAARDLVGVFGRVLNITDEEAADVALGVLYKEIRLASKAGHSVQAKWLSDVCGELEDIQSGSSSR